MHSVEICRVVNQVFYCNKFWGQRYLKLEHVSAKYRGICFRLTMVSVVLGFIFLNLVAIMTRNRNNSLYALMSTDCSMLTSFLQFLIFCLIETALIFDPITNSLFICATLYATYITMDFWLCRMCTSWPEFETQLDEASELETRILYYKAIYILNTDCNIVFGTLIFPLLKLGIITVFVLSVVSVICFYNKIEATSLVLMTICIFTCVPVLIPILLIMSKLYGMSVQFSTCLQPKVNVISNKKEKFLINQQLRSCSIIRCQIGNLYYMESRAKLTILHQILNVLMYLLVNLKT